MNDVLSDASINQKIIVNCTGLGARELCNDLKVHPVKGQVVMLPAQPSLDYLFCAPGYLFPRKDAVVVGGTEETTFKDDKPDINTLHEGAQERPASVRANLARPARAHPSKRTHAADLAYSEQVGLGA